MIHAQHVFLQLTGTAQKLGFETKFLSHYNSGHLADVTITNYRILSYMKCA